MALILSVGKGRGKGGRLIDNSVIPGLYTIY